jgi:D-amino-acid dehydrogenase
LKVAVVGAGVLGASCAYHLRSAGADTVVVDGAHQGRATAAGAGIVCPWNAGHDHRSWYRLAAGGARYYPELLQRLAEDGETDTGYRKVGALCVSDDAAALGADEERVLARHAGAPEMGEVARLTPAQARALFPPLNENLSALHIAGAARLDGRLLAAALLRAARRKGAAVETGVAQLVRKGDRITGVATPQGTIEADAVVVAGGVWAAPLLANLGLRLPIDAQRGQILHLRLPGTATGLWPVILQQTSHYMLSFDDSRIVAGATREDGTGLDYRVTASGQRELLDRALTLAPGLADATVVETRIGFRPMPASGAPLLGKAPGFEGLLIGNGLGSSGLTIGPLAGKLIAAEALRHATEIDLAPYAPFAKAA